MSDDLLRSIASTCIDLGVKTHRAEIVITRTAKTIAAFDGRTEVNQEDVKKAMELALAHRMRSRPFEPPTLNKEKLEKSMQQHQHEHEHQHQHQNPKQQKKQEQQPQEPDEQQDSNQTQACPAPGAGLRDRHAHRCACHKHAPQERSNRPPQDQRQENEYPRSAKPGPIPAPEDARGRERYCHRRHHSSSSSLPEGPIRPQCHSSVERGYPGKGDGLGRPRP